MVVFPRLRWLLLILFGIYLLIYPGSTLLVALGRVPVWGLWMGGALLLLQGTLCGLWLTANYGRRGALAAGALLLLAWGIEHLGVTTGFPFGSYGYTNALQPKVGGVVPLAIPFAWLLVVPAAIATAERLLPRGGVLLRVLSVSTLALLLDITIEPVAVHINGYWTWLDSGIYDGVPLSNFVAWWLTSLVLVIVLYGLLGVPGKRVELQRAGMLPLLPPALFVLNLTMFALVNLAHNQTLAGVIGILLLTYLISQLRPLRYVRTLLQFVGWAER